MNIQCIEVEIQSRPSRSRKCGRQRSETYKHRRHHRRPATSPPRGRREHAGNVVGINGLPAREQADSPLREKVNYRFGVTSTLVVEAAGLDELPGPGCAFFMRLE